MVTKCLAILTTKEDASNPECKPRILQLHADAKVAGKAITITEIVKRRLKEHGQNVTQTTLVQDKPAANAGTNGGNRKVTAKKHLQDEGYEKPKEKAKVNVQIIIRLQKDVETGE